MKNLKKFLIGVFGASAVVAVALDARGKARRNQEGQKPYYYNSHKPFSFYEKYMKRPIDAYFASLGLVVLSPVLGITAMLVKKRLGSPILFEQDRPGKEGKIFKLYKFRTMTDAKDANGNMLSDEARLTPFGEKLRSTSIDELPELINIAEGDMSLIGPRPLLTDYLPYYYKDEIHRHDVRPGLTGWAQIHGRDSVQWKEKFAMDLFYVHNINFLLDLKILFGTVSKVIKKSDILDGANIQVERLDVLRRDELK